VLLSVNALIMVTLLALGARAYHDPGATRHAVCRAAGPVASSLIASMVVAACGWVCHWIGRPPRALTRGERRAMRGPSKRALRNALPYSVNSALRRQANRPDGRRLRPSRGRRPREVHRLLAHPDADASSIFDRPPTQDELRRPLRKTSSGATNVPRECGTTTPPSTHADMPPPCSAASLRRRWTYRAGPRSRWPSRGSWDRAAQSHGASSARRFDFGACRGHSRH
jgi:hypothetical protein